MAESRTVEARKADVLAALEGQHDLWLATADRSGRPHLIAVSAWWDGQDLLIATRVSTRTAKNLSAGQNVRLAGGYPADAIVIDATEVESEPVGRLDPRSHEHTTPPPYQIRRGLKNFSSTLCLQPNPVDALETVRSSRTILYSDGYEFDSRCRP
jgi:Pyridoxamine 5'-phosphate oxidase